MHAALISDLLKGWSNLNKINENINDNNKNEKTTIKMKKKQRNSGIKSARKMWIFSIRVIKLYFELFSQNFLWFFCSISSTNQSRIFDIEKIWIFSDKLWERNKRQEMCCMCALSVYLMLSPRSNAPKNSVIERGALKARTCDSHNWMRFWFLSACCFAWLFCTI